VDEGGSEMMIPESQETSLESEKDFEASQLTVLGGENNSEAGTSEQLPQSGPSAIIVTPVEQKKKKETSLKP
jgi:hypothetical protein